MLEEVQQSTENTRLTVGRYRPAADNVPYRIGIGCGGGLARFHGAANAGVGRLGMAPRVASVQFLRRCATHLNARPGMRQK